MVYVVEKIIIMDFGLLEVIVVVVKDGKIVVVGDLEDFQVLVVCFLYVIDRIFEDKIFVFGLIVLYEYLIFVVNIIINCLFVVFYLIFNFFGIDIVGVVIKEEVLDWLWDVVVWDF